MTTALDIITGASRLIGVTFKSEALDSDEAADGLVSLNDMLSSWSNNGLLVPYRTWESFNVSGASFYSIGAGQTLNTVRPSFIRAAFIRSGNVDYSMECITDEQYESITFKSITSPFPDYLTYDNGYPYGKIRMYPQLSPSAELHLLTEKPLTSFATLTTTVDLPPGWNKALRFNLAIDMAPEYGVEVPASVVKGASDSKAEIMLAIAKNRPIKFKRNVLQNRNIYNAYQ